MKVSYECPECGSYDTKQVHIEWMEHEVEETRICDECPAQFTNAYYLTDKELDFVGEPA